MALERVDAEELIRVGLRRLLEENYELFVGKANERAITSLLAGYLADDHRIPAGLRVDHEYNRLGLGYTKNLRVWIQGELLTDQYDNPIEKPRIPDILVHGLGDNEDNVIAIEVKVNAFNNDGDKSKIWALMSDPLAYQFGVLLSLPRKKGPDGPIWTPLWAWNPEPGNTAVNYEPAFDEDTAAELAASGREEMSKRLKARGRG